MGEGKLAQLVRPDLRVSPSYPGLVRSPAERLARSHQGYEPPAWSIGCRMGSYNVVMYRVLQCH